MYSDLMKMFQLGCVKEVCFVYECSQFTENMVAFSCSNKLALQED